MKFFLGKDYEPGEDYEKEYLNYGKDVFTIILRADENFKELNKSLYVLKTEIEFRWNKKLK